MVSGPGGPVYDAWLAASFHLSARVGKAREDYDEAFQAADVPAVLRCFQPGAELRDAGGAAQLEAAIEALVTLLHQEAEKLEGVASFVALRHLLPLVVADFYPNLSLAGSGGPDWDSARRAADDAVWLSANWVSPAWADPGEHLLEVTSDLEASLAKMMTWSFWVAYLQACRLRIHRGQTIIVKRAHPLSTQTALDEKTLQAEEAIHRYTWRDWSGDSWLGW